MTGRGSALHKGKPNTFKLRRGEKTNDFLKRMTSRKWMGFVIVLVMAIYVMGGDSVVVKMEGLPDRMEAFFVWFEKMMPFLGIVAAYFGFSLGQGRVDAAKEAGAAQVESTRIVSESRNSVNAA